MNGYPAVVAQRDHHLANLVVVQDSCVAVLLGHPVDTLSGEALVEIGLELVVKRLNPLEKVCVPVLGVLLRIFDHLLDVVLDALVRTIENVVKLGRQASRLLTGRVVDLDLAPTAVCLEFPDPIRRGCLQVCAEVNELLCRPHPESCKP